MRTPEQQKRRANIVGNCPVEEGEYNIDNLAIVLACYFSKHIDRPENDEDDPETGWGKWVMEKTDRALGLIADEILIER